MPASDLQAFNFTTLQGASGKPKLVGSRGSMVAKLKLKGRNNQITIDESGLGGDEGERRPGWSVQGNAVASVQPSN